MDPFVARIITAAATVLLPVLPMLLLFRLLPDQQMSVEGPFQNLTVRATGAAAGWFVGFVGLFFALLVPSVKGSTVEPDARDDLWMVCGQIALPDGTWDGGTFDVIPDPPRIKPVPNGSFTISGVQVQTSGDRTTLNFKRDSLMVGVTLDSTEPDVKFFPKDRKISIGKRVLISTKG